MFGCLLAGICRRDKPVEWMGHTSQDEKRLRAVRDSEEAMVVLLLGSLERSMYSVEE